MTVGDLATNCYLVTDEGTGKTLIIDPGDEADFISTTLLEKRLIPKAIILTHGHYDHCLAVLELKLNFNLPIYLHEADLFLYQKAPKSASFWSPVSPVKGRNGKAERGSGIFTGDTLFAHGVGRTDHSYSSLSDLQKSLSKLRTINLELKTSPLIYPGHEDFGLPISSSPALYL